MEEVSYEVIKVIKQWRKTQRRKLWESRGRFSKIFIRTFIITLVLMCAALLGILAQSFWPVLSKLSWIVFAVSYIALLVLTLIAWVCDYFDVPDLSYMYKRKTRLAKLEIKFQSLKAQTGMLAKRRSKFIQNWISRLMKKPDLLKDKQSELKELWCSFQTVGLDSREKVQLLKKETDKSITEWQIFFGVVAMVSATLFSAEIFKLGSRLFRSLSISFDKVWIEAVKLPSMALWILGGMISAILLFIFFVSYRVFKFIYFGNFLLKQRNKKLLAVMLNELIFYDSFLNESGR